MSSYTDDLLSELKETVAADVAAEEARLRAELEARAAAEEEAARQAEAVRRAEIDARLEAERQRRRLANESRRTVATDAAAAERAEPVIPRAGTPATVERLAPLESAPAGAAPKGHGAGFYFVVMGLPMLCITAIVVAWIMTAPQPDLNPQPGAVAGDVATPPAPVLEVAGPGEAAEVPDNQPVSAQIGAEQAADGEDGAKADDPAPAGKAAPSNKGDKKATAKGSKGSKKGGKAAGGKAAGSKAVGSKAEKPKPKNGLSGELFKGQDVSDFMDDK